MRRPRYADVAATLALVVALGGTSYAVTALPRNSVGTSQIKAHAVTKAKLAAGLSVIGPRGPAGPAGAAGSPGTAGASGLSGVQIVTAGESTPGIGSATASCPPGKLVVGGGAFQSISTSTIYRSYPINASAWNASGSPGITAYAICAAVSA